MLSTLTKYEICQHQRLHGDREASIVGPGLEDEP